jgi:hypothetical protein
VKTWLRTVCALSSRRGTPLGGSFHKDVHNFDETTFMNGVAARSAIITNADRIGRTVVVQSSKRERTNSMKCVNALSWCILLFIILSSKPYHAI